MSLPVGDAPLQLALPKSMKRSAILLFLLFCPHFACFAGERVTDKKLGFSFTVPDPFVRPENVTTGTDVVHTFMDGEPTPENPAMVLQVQRLGAVFDPRKHLTTADLPKQEGVIRSIELFPWQGLKLDMVREEATAEEAPKTVAFVLQIPLAREGVQLLGGGPVEKEEEIRKAFTAFAAGFKNLRPLYLGLPAISVREPLSGSERASKLSRGIFQMAITTIVVVLIVRAVFRMIRRKKQGSTKG